MIRLFKVLPLVVFLGLQSVMGWAQTPVVPVNPVYTPEQKQALAEEKMKQTAINLANKKPNPFPVPFANTDCFDATSVCQNTYVQTTPPTGSGSVTDITTSSNCLLEGEKNGVWYVFTAQTSGTFGFNINTNPQPQIDYDFALWNITNSGCSSVASQTPIRCNYSAQASTTGLDAGSTQGGNLSYGAGDTPIMPGINVTAGQTYVLLVSRYSANQQGYDITFTGTASIFDQNPPNLVRAVHQCPANNPRRAILEFSEPVDCATASGLNISIAHPSGGTANVTGVTCGPDLFSRYVTVTYNAVPDVGGDFPVTVNGSITDNCGNAAALPVTLQMGYPDFTFSTSTSLCFGGLGTIIVNATPASGSAVLNYSLDGGAPQASNTFTNVSPGTHTVTFTSNDNCSISKSITLTAPPSAVVATLNGVTPGSCTGAGGSITVSGSGGVPGYTYTLNPGGVTQANGSFTNLTPNTYTVTVTDANNCTATASATVAGNSPPTVTASASPTSYCSGGSATLTANGSGGTGAITYSWGTAGNGASITVSPNTTTTYTVTATDANSCTATATVTVTVNNNLTVTATASPTSFCPGSNSTLTANAPGSGVTYNWGAAGTGATITVSAAGTYTVTATDANGCTGTASVTVSVNNNLTVTANASPAAICSGGNSTLTANAPGTGVTYNWGAAGTGATITVSAAGTYVVTATDANGCSGTASVTVTVNPNPTITATASPAAICVGQSSTLTATGGVTYTWNPGGLTGSPVTVTPATTTTYTVVGTDDNGCTGSATVTVTVNPLPNITATANPATICAGGSSTLTATGGITYTWNPGNLSGDVVTVSPVSTTTYTVTGVDANGCSNTATVTVTVNANLTVTATANPASICDGASTTITANAIGTGVTYDWGAAGTGATITISTAGTYNVLATDANGCTGTASVTVTANPNPTITASASPAAICAGQSSTLTATGGVTYTWNPGGLTGSPVTVTPATTTTYTVIGTDANGCTGSATVTVTVNPLPNITATANPATICAGGSSTLTATGGVTYTWNPGNLSGDVVTVSPASTTTYTVTGIDANGCSNTASVTVTVIQNPTINLAANGSTVCEGNDATVTITPGETGVDYQLVIGGSNYGAPQTGSGSNLTFTIAAADLPLGATTVTINASISVSGCSANATQDVTVTVNPTPTVSITASATTLCVGESVTLTASGADTYLWTPTNSANAVLTDSPAATTTYTVVGTTSGCTASATVTVTVLPVPVVNLVLSGSTVCEGTDGSFTIAASDPNTIYNVVVNGNPFGAPLTGTGADIVVSVPASNLQNGNNLVQINATATAGSCSSSASGNTTIVVNPNPVINLQINGSTVCENNNGTVTIVSSQNGVTYQLQLNGVNYGALVNGNGSDITLTVLATDLVLGGNNVTVIANSTVNGCSSTQTANDVITVVQQPVISLVVAPLNTCENQGTELYIYNTDPNLVYNVTVNGNVVVANQLGSGQTDTIVVSAALLNLGVNNYTVTANAAAVGCTASQTVNGTLQQFPTLAFVLDIDGATACSNGDGFFYINNSVVGVEYDVFVGGVQIGGGIPGDGSTLMVTVPIANLNIGANTVVVYANGTAPVCAPLQIDSVTVEIVNPPVINLNNGQGSTVCDGQDGIVTILSSENGVTYIVNSGVYTSGPLVGNGANLTFNIPASALQLGANNAVITASAGTPFCLNTDTLLVVVTVEPTPIVTLNASVSPVCVGVDGVVTIQSQIDATYQLILNGVNFGAPVAGTGGAVTVNIPPANLVSGNNTLVIVATVTTPAGCTASESQSYTLVLQPAVVPVPLPNTPLCLTSPTKIVFSSSILGYGYQLFYNGSPISPEVQGLSGALSITVDESQLPNQGQALITVVVHNLTTGCKISQDFIQEILRSPQDLTIQALTVCQGQDSILRVVGPELGVEYQLLDLAGNPVGNPQIVTGSSATELLLPLSDLLPGTYTFGVRATVVASGCSRKIPVIGQVVVQPAPDEIDVRVLSACASSNAKIVLYNSQSGVSYEFILNNVSVTTLGGNGLDSMVVNLPTAGFAPGVYTLEIRAINPANGCFTVLTDLSQLIIREEPLTDAFSVFPVNPTNVCKGETANVVISNSQPGVTYVLVTSTGDTISTVLAGTGGDIILEVEPDNLTPGASFTFEVRASNQYCTVTLDVQAEISVKNFPAGPIEVIGQTALCNGSSQTVTLVAPRPTGFTLTYQWTKNGVDLAGETSDTLVVNENTPLGQGNYNVRLVDTQFGCTDTIQGVRVTFSNPALSADLDSDEQIICSGDSTRIFVTNLSATGANEYQWFTEATGGTGTVFDKEFITPPLMETTTFYVEAFNNNCSNGLRTPIEITVIPMPVAKFIIDRDTTDTLYAPSLSTVKFTNQSTNAVSYQWFFGDDSTSTQLNPQHRYRDEGIYYAKLVAYNSLGCTDTFTVGRIWVSERIFDNIPTVFSPNGDGPGENEIFNIELLGFDFFCVQIFDRWGHLVFDNACDPTIHWNGTVENNGDQCPEGVYVYKLRAERIDKNIIVNHSGTITIIR